MIRVAEYLRDHGGQFLTGLAAVLLSTFTVFPDFWFWLTLLAGVGAAVAAIFAESGKQAEIGRLERQLKTVGGERDVAKSALDRKVESAHLIAHAVAVDMARLCEVDVNTVRASVYERRESDWIRLVRYSASAAYREGGRKTIPLGSGLLQRAFERAHAEVVDLPDRERAPVQYEKEQVKLGLQPGLSEKLIMPSRSYGLFRFEGPPTDPLVRTFVLCLESTDPQGVVGGQVGDLLEPWLWSLHRVYANLEPS